MPDRGWSAHQPSTTRPIGAEAYAIPTEEPDAARVKSAYHGYELVGLNGETSRLHS